MKRILGKVVTLLVCALGVSAALPACTDNDQSLFIRNALFPAQNRQNGCIYTDDPQQPALFEGILDVGLRDNYTGVFLVGNQMIPRGDPLSTRAESSRAHINGGIVRVTRTDGAVIREFTSYATGFADPQNNNQADFGSASLIAIDAPTAKVLRDEIFAEFAKLPPGTSLAQIRRFSIQVLSNIKIFGKTLGGTDVESAEYQFPIRVCVGCLVNFPAGVNDSTKNKPGDTRVNCLGTPAAAATATTQTQAPCEYGQDEGVSCKTCNGLEFCDFFN